MKIRLQLSKTINKNNIQIVSLILSTGILLFIYNDFIFSKILKKINSEFLTVHNVGLKYSLLITCLVLALTSLLIFFLRFYPEHNNNQSIKLLLQAFVKQVFSISRKFKNLNLTLIQKFSFLTVLLSGVFVRSYYLSQPMRYDESSTFLNFVNRSFWDMFYYPVPNNHVFQSILAKISVTLFGSSSAVFRLPVFFFGILSVITIFLLSQFFFNNQSGFFSIFLFAVWPYLVFYSTNARGYSLIVFWTLILIFIGYQIIKNVSLDKTILFSIVSALGLFTIPIMLYPIIGIICWITISLILHHKRKLLIRFLIPTGLSLAIFTGFLYLPVVFVTNGVDSIIRNNFVSSQSFTVFISELLPHLKEINTVYFVRYIPIYVKVVFIFFLSFGIMVLFAKKDYVKLLLLPSVLLSTIIILFIQRRIPYVRIWIYFLPIFFIVADEGFSFILSKFTKIRNFLFISIAIISVTFSIYTINTNSIIKNGETGRFSEGQIVANFLGPILKEQDTIIVHSPASSILYYYLMQNGINSHPDWFYNQSSDQKTLINMENIQYIILKKDSNLVTDFTEEETDLIFEYENAAVYKINK